MTQALPFLLPRVYSADREARGLSVGRVESRRADTNRWLVWLTRDEAREMLADAETRAARDLTHEAGCAGVSLRASTRLAARRLRERIGAVWPEPGQ